MPENVGNRGGAKLHPVADVDLMYLDLLKKTLTRHLQPEKFRPMRPAQGSMKNFVYSPVQKILGKGNMEIVRQHRYDHASGHHLEWPPEALTMIRLNQLDYLQSCLADVLERRVPGDFIETGVWRGGTCIFMRAVLKVYGNTERTVWVADSFQGLPEPDPRYPVDRNVNLHEYGELAVSLEQVKRNFDTFGMLDDQVKFLQGWFKDTLPTAPVQQLAILRIDGDLYQSTTEALESLYGKLSPGGYVFIDDYGAMHECEAAVEDFRSHNSITDEMHRLDEVAYWVKSA